MYEAHIPPSSIERHCLYLPNSLGDSVGEVFLGYVLELFKDEPAQVANSHFPVVEILDDSGALAILYPDLV